MTVVDCIREWQTLLAGFIALGAAGWTVWTINKQIALQRQAIDEDRNRHRESLLRRSRVARAGLSDALSALCEFSRISAGFAEGRVEASPERPVDAIALIRTSIGFVDEDSASALWKLLIEYQVHNARLFDGSRQAGEAERSHRIYDAVRLYASAERLFPFARNEVETVADEAVSRQAMISALKQCVGIDRYFGRDPQIASVKELICLSHHDAEVVPT